MAAHDTARRWVVKLDDVGLDDVGLVGGKAASLGELRQAIGDRISVPEGFAITANAYRDIVVDSGLAPRLARILKATDWSDRAKAVRSATRLRELVQDAPWPRRLREQIELAYRDLMRGHRMAVAVRSSATAEDLPGASFAGLHETVLNVRNEAALERAVRRCMASIFTERAITYRNAKGFDHEKVALAIAVQVMVDASQGASGVIFTLETESGCREVVMVTGVLGLGETIVQGMSDPDEFLVHKQGFIRGHRAVLRHRIGAKQVRMSRTLRGTKLIRVPHTARNKPCLTDDEVLDLAGQALVIEAHYSARAGRAVPMDIEWAKDGHTGKLFILQARPETVHAAADAGYERFRLDGDGRLLVSGTAVGDRIGSGRVRPVRGKQDLPLVEAGEVLVAATTSPDWEPIMRLASAIVTEQGGRTCHAAIVARELGIPAVVGAAGALKILTAGQEVTVSCAEGDVGHVRAGLIPFSVERERLAPPPAGGPKLMVNVGDPSKAFATAKLPVDGVGLARIEFIVTQSIGIHPMALVALERVANGHERRLIAAMTAGYATGADYFVERLSEGVGVIAAAFYPRPVIVRLSDFKSNEYRALLGGSAFEPIEDNPMIGLRGASRYLHPSYAPAFALECRAMARVRGELGLDNVILMVPFCRRVSEARAIVAAMARHGLARGRNGLRIYAMAEIPSNGVSIDAFAEIFDGFSIGSNDLTQLTLGIDRDSALLAQEFDEQDPAVMALIAEIIAGAHRHNRPCGLCGQAPSDKPAFADWLARQGIDSISLNPDSVPLILKRWAGRRRSPSISKRPAAAA